MPIEWVDDGDAETMPRPAGGVGLPAESSVPSFSELAGAAFRQENIVGSAIDMLQAQTGFKPDPNGHNPVDVIDGTTYLRDHHLEFVGSQSEAETRSRMSRIDRETKRRQTIAASGLPGVIASTFAGAFDPTILLPGFIAVKGARGLSVAGTAAASGAAVGAGAAVQEGVLQVTQITRTAEESAMGVAGATILGGLLGGAAAGLSRRQFDKIGSGLEDIARGAGEETSGVARAGSAGAAAAADARGDGRLAPMLGLEKSRTVMNLSPVTRLQSSEFHVARNTVRDIADAGLELAENAEGIATSVGGTIENRIRMRQGGLGEAVDEMSRQYASYYLSRQDVSAIERATIGVRGAWANLNGSKGGKLSEREFREEIGKAMIRGDQHPVPEVQAAAEAYRRDVFDPLKKLAVEVGLLPKDVQTSTAMSYLTRVYNHEKIIAQRGEFVGRLVGHLEGGQRGASAGVEAIKGKRFTIETEAERIKADLVQQVIPVIGQSRRVTSDGDVVPGVQSGATRLREQRKVAGAEERSARAELRDAERARQDEVERIDREEAQQERASERAAARLLKDLKRGRASGPMPTLADVIRKNGGVRTARFGIMGDLLRTEERGEALDGKMKGLLNNKTGRDVEDVLNDAILDGYLPAEATLDTLVDAIRRTAAGEKIYSRADGEGVDYTRALESMNADLERAGHDVSKMRPADLRAVINEFGGDATAAKSAGEIDARLDEFSRRQQDAAEAYDPKALKLDDLDAAIRDLDELAPAMREEARRLRDMLRERQRGMRGLSREEAEAQRFVDLSSAEIRAIAEDVTDQILGNASRVIGMDIVAGPRGPLKARTLNIPDGDIEDFLEKDVERVARIYTRTMSADGELAAKFGDVQMEGPLAALRDEKNARIAAVTTEAERTRIEAEYQRSRADLEALRDRLRGTYRMPEDPTALTYRAAKVAQNLNYVRMLGGMVISSLTDVARPIMKYGLTKTFRDGFVPFATSLQQARLAGREARLAGTALDMLLGSRTHAMADLFDDFQKGTKFERAIEMGAAKFGVITLMAPWNGVMKQFVGTIAMAEMLRATKAAAEGRATADQIRRLAASGIDANLATRIHDQFSRYGARSEPLGDATKRMRDFAARTIGIRNRKEAIDLGRVRHPEEIAEALGMRPEDLTGFKHTVDNYALAHAQKRHGDDAKEALQGQVGLTGEDFARIPDILDNFDFVSAGGKNAAGRDVLIYEKVYGDTILYVEEVRAGKSELAMTSMRKVKEKNGGPARADAEAPAPNVRDDAGMGRKIARRETDGKEGGAEVNGLMLPNTENWIDRAAREAFRTALVREIDNTIITPGLEKPLWTSSTVGKMVSQFKSFGFASTQRILLAGLQQKDAAFLNGAAMSLALGALVYWSKSQLRDEVETEKMRTATWAKWATEAADNSGLLSLPFEANNMVEKVTGGKIGMSALTGEQASRYASRNALGSLLGPSFDAVGSGLKVMGSAATGEWAASDTRALRRLLPMQNLFYIRRTLDAVEDQANAAMGLPVKKAGN